jgi:uncharacterized protein (UPF0248 family)
MHPLRVIFNRIIWNNKERKEEYEITYIHRGAKNDRKTIHMNSITKVEKSVFIYDDNGSENTIPLHRVLIVRNIKTGNIIWKKV